MFPRLGLYPPGEAPVFRRLSPVRSLTDYPEIAAGTGNWESFSGRTRSVGTRRGERAGIYPENGLILPFFLAVHRPWVNLMVRKAQQRSTLPMLVISPVQLDSIPVAICVAYFTSYMGGMCSVRHRKTLERACPPAHEWPKKANQPPSQDRIYAPNVYDASAKSPSGLPFRHRDPCRD